MAEKFRLSESVEYSNGAIVSKTLIDKNTGTVTLFAFDGGQGLSEHTAPFEAMVNVVDGRAEVTIAGAPHVLSAGESIVMPAGVPHAVKAVEKFKMLLVMVKG